MCLLLNYYSFIIMKLQQTHLPYNISQTKPNEQNLAQPTIIPFFFLFFFSFFFFYSNFCPLSSNEYRSNYISPFNSFFFFDIWFEKFQLARYLGHTLIHSFVWKQYGRKRNANARSCNMRNAFRPAFIRV